MTLQYWGQPFIATGKYHDHKVVLDPMADNYHDRFWAFSPEQKTFDEQNNQYRFDLDLNGSTDYVIGNNNFKVREFLSNLVLRWEYTPGSTLFIVWNQTRDYSNGMGDMKYFNDLGDLFDRDNNIPHNIFLLKLSYRFGLR